MNLLHSRHAETKGQPLGIGSLLPPPCETQGFSFIDRYLSPGSNLSDTSFEFLREYLDLKCCVRSSHFFKTFGEAVLTAGTAGIISWV